MVSWLARQREICKFFFKISAYENVANVTVLEIPVNFQTFLFPASVQLKYI